jgi:hypothetical protein
MSGARQTALILHGLTTDDREWILSQLVEERVEELRGLLVELRELGIPADGTLIRNAVQRGATDAGAGASTDIAALARASAEQMRVLLVGEPDCLIALVFATSAWPWKERFLSLLEAERAQRIGDLALRLTTGTVTRQAIVADLAARLKTVPQESASIRMRSHLLDWTGIGRRLHQGWTIWRR